MIPEKVNDKANYSGHVSIDFLVAGSRGGGAHLKRYRQHCHDAGKRVGHGSDIGEVHVNCIWPLFVPFALDSQAKASSQKFKEAQYCKIDHILKVPPQHCRAQDATGGKGVQPGPFWPGPG